MTAPFDFRLPPKPPVLLGSGWSARWRPVRGWVEGVVGQRSVAWATWDWRRRGGVGNAMPPLGFGYVGSEWSVRWGPGREEGSGGSEWWVRAVNGSWGVLLQRMVPCPHQYGCLEVGMGGTLEDRPIGAPVVGSLVGS